MIKRIACGAVAIAAAITGLTAASAAGANAGSPATCTAAHLRPVYGGSQGAAGTLQDTWRLRNVGHATCDVQGYPVVHNYRGDGRPLRTSVRHLGTPHQVLLAPGQHASFRLRYADPGILGCTPEPARMLTIRVPDTSLPVIAKRGEHACRGKLRETPLIHGG